MVRLEDDDDIDLTGEMANASRFLLDRNAERVVAASRLMGVHGVEELMEHARDGVLTPSESRHLRDMLPQLPPEIAPEAGRLLDQWQRRHPASENT